jgi:transposase-like protein
MATAPKSLTEAILYFADPDNALQYLVSLRWPEGVACPYCHTDKPSFLTTRRIWKCRNVQECGKQFSAKIGTIFEESPIGLDKWLTAVWLISNCKNGVSSYEIARDLKVTQKTAWFMLQRIRTAMQDETTGGKLSGEVEVDETFIGGKARNMHKARRARKITGRGPTGKEVVFGMLERGGKVIVGHVDGRKRKHVDPVIREHVEAGSAIFSDELKSYNKLEGDFQHAVINHAIEYVNGNVHTNGMENFWSLLKRGLHGTYISVEPFHLFRYLDEQAFRFNQRKENDAARFERVCRQIVGRRLTWDKLTGKEANM